MWPCQKRFHNSEQNVPGIVYRISLLLSYWIGTPLAVAAFVDTAKILGLPKFRLRDSSGNPYLPDKALLQEPLATVNDHAGIIFTGEVNKRKAYIRSYVKR